MSLLNLYTFFYEIQKDVLKTIYWSYLFSCNESERVLKRFNLSLTVRIYPNLSVCHRCCNIVPHSRSLCGKEQSTFLAISAFVFNARKNVIRFGNDQMLLLISLNLSMSKTLGACGLPMRVPTLSWCPPNSRKVAVGQQLWLLPAAPHWHAHLPMVPGAMPSTLTLPRHAGMLSHSWKQEETGLPAYFSHRVLLSFQQLWNETKQWETSESSPHSSWVVKAGAFFFSTVCCHGWRAAFQSLLASSAMTHHVACWSNDVSFSLLFSVTSADLQSLNRSMFQQLSAQTHPKQMEGAGVLSICPTLSDCHTSH